MTTEARDSHYYTWRHPTSQETGTSANTPCELVIEPADVSLFEQAMELPVSVTHELQIADGLVHRTARPVKLLHFGAHVDQGLPELIQACAQCCGIRDLAVAWND